MKLKSEISFENIMSLSNNTKYCIKCLHFHENEHKIDFSWFKRGKLCFVSNKFKIIQFHSQMFKVHFIHKCNSHENVLVSIKIV